ncbi:hypothetical protein F4778DRAFT_434739 [Xylariomycetidae sp. FL2044]|nr:hypothetical protein F4778DRAFT_434739 [Xylariomycetidae sp. FL2044]
MPKWDKTRNYYADLELPQTASTEDIKKQFRKLALKYHPDRNPGKETEYHSKFQIIQSAQEVLTDENLRRQYDDARRSNSRMPGASGVRGNPWQDIHKNYPPPPKRAPATSQARTTSGAQRYASFASGMPRNARTTPKDDPQTRRERADAWDNMRARKPPTTPGRAPTSATRDTRTSGTGPVPPPRTAYQQQKAQAAFGSRKSGYTPHSPNVADEPPVTNKNYFTTRTHSNIFNGATDDTDADVDPFAEGSRPPMTSRPSAPYHSQSGEKTRLFGEGPGLGRSTSTRVPPQRQPMPGTFPRPRQRSSSTPRTSSNDADSEDSNKAHTGSSATPDMTPHRKSSGNYSSFQSRASDKYKPKPAPSTMPSEPRPGTASAHTQRVYCTYPNIESYADNCMIASEASGSSTQADGGPSVYASTTFSQVPKPRACPTTDTPCGVKEPAPSAQDWASLYKRGGLSSEDSQAADSPSLLPHEAQQRSVIHDLVGKSLKLGIHLDSAVAGTKSKMAKTSSRANEEGNATADHCYCSSFSFPDGSDLPAGTKPGPKPFTSNSADNINTKFAQGENPEGWQFTAGTASATEANTTARTRPPSRSRPVRRPTPRVRTSQTDQMPSTYEGYEDANVPKFSAGEWSAKIGSHHFEPQPSHSTSTSPTRRANSKKPKPVKMTAGTAGLVDEEDSEEFRENSRPASGVPPETTDSPIAMDIDSPPPEKADAMLKVPQSNAARNIPVEPHRADWRAGNVDASHPQSANPVLDTEYAKRQFTEKPGTQPSSAPSTANPFAAHQGGSEDTEAFRTTFADFSNVEPFKDPAPSGLKSFADLRSTLPFESKPSEQIPIAKDLPPVQLQLPTLPIAPRLPATVAVPGIRPNNSQYRKYAHDFHSYEDKWATYKETIMAHLTTRQNNYKARRQQLGQPWLESTQGGDVARTYLVEEQQDQLVLQHYLDACREHQKRVTEFIEFRDRVK